MQKGMVRCTRLSKDKDCVTRVNAERYGYFGKKYEVEKGNDCVTRVNVESIVFFRRYFGKMY